MALPQSQTPTPTPTPTLAGYRLVRKLGVGRRAEIFLGVPDSDVSSSPRTAALKLFRPEVPRDDIGRELAALGRVELAHCVRLIDVATADSGLAVPILARVQRGSVAQLLRDRDGLEVGEAVTLLAPLPATMTELHALGIAHSNLGPSSVHLGAAGEPVLLGFGHSRHFDAGLSVAALDAEAAAVADRDRLAALVDVVLNHTRRGGSPSRIRDLLAWLSDSSGSRGFEFAAELEDRLFDLAEPLPIEFTRVPAASGSPVPARIGKAQSDGQRAGPEAAVPNPAMKGAGLVPSRLRDAILSNPLDQLRSRAVRAGRGVRKPFWIVAAAVVIALVAAIVLVPEDGTPASQRGLVASPRASPTGRGAVLPDDPVLALPMLLTARNRCLRDLSVLCLDSVDEQSSAALRDDAGLIRAIQSGQQIPASATITAKTPTLVERLGDSALVDLHTESGPASALMIRGEAGWRIRGFLERKTVQP